MVDNNSQWVFCPYCSGKTRAKVYSNTVVLNFPLFCPKCKRIAVIDIKQLKVELKN